MSGALNRYAGGGPTLPPPTVNAAPYYGDQGGGAGGYGSDPSTMAMILGAAGSAPPSPLVQSLMDSASELYGKPGEMVGALNSSRTRYNSAVSDKMAAINRAYSLLASMDPSGPGRTNLPLLAASAGLLQPTRTGTIGESIGNAASGANTAIDHQREIERALAQAMGNNDIEGGSTEIEGATGDNAMLNQRYGNADRMMGQAAQAQGREDLAHARMYGSALQYKGRIDAATINGNKNRWKFIGNDPGDPTVGRYLDQSDPSGLSVMAGPAAGAKPTAAGASEWKYKAWLASHPGDTAGALDFVSGHRRMDPAEIHKFSRGEAQRELGQGADEADIAALADKIEQSFGAAAAPAGGGAPGPGGASGPTPQKLTADEIKQSLANARAAIAAGKPKEPIIARLKAAGIDTSGL